MSSITADGLAAPVASPVGGEVGPLEQKHLHYANYRAVAGSGEITKTHSAYPCAMALRLTAVLSPATEFVLLTVVGGSSLGCKSGGLDFAD